MTLFDQLPNVRPSDPQTSKDAAESMKPALSTQRRSVLSYVIAKGSDGATAYEIAVSLGAQQNVISRRLTDLVQLGLAEPNGRLRPGATGRNGLVFVVTPKGREA